MKNSVPSHTKSTLTLWILIATPSLHATPIKDLALHILSDRCSHVAKEQRRLLAQLKETPSADLCDTPLCDLVIDALEKDDTFPVLAEPENRTLIADAMRILHNVPGFFSVLKRILLSVDNPDNAKGSLHVLEHALTLAPDTELCALGYATLDALTGGAPSTPHSCSESPEPESPHTSTKHHCIFDIITQERATAHAFKCKYIPWEQLHVEAKRGNAMALKQQFLDLRKLVANYNKQNQVQDPWKDCSDTSSDSEEYNTPKTLRDLQAHAIPDDLSGTFSPKVHFVVKSKTPIPQAWRTWFQSHAIDFQAPDQE